MPTTTTAVIKHAANMQKIGAYKAALIKLQEADLWDYERPNLPPNTVGLSELQSAELYLSAGKLYGFYGIIYKDAQEISKNLLTQAYELLIQLEDCNDLCRDCSNHLALAYWRMGAFKEARDWLSNSLLFKLHANNPNRLHTFIVASLVHLSSKEYKEVMVKFDVEKENFTNSGDAYLLGLFYMNRGAAKHGCSDLSGALSDQIISRDTFHSLGHRQLVAHASNNIAFFYKSVCNFDKALEFARQALFSAEQAEDLRQTGCVNDTLALIYYDQGEYEKALTFAQRSIELLERTECYQYLFDSRKTMIEILLKLERTDDWLELYADTLINVVQPHCPNERTTLMQLVGDHIRDRSVLPANFQIVEKSITRRIEVTTDHHAHLGLKKGCVAHVKETEVENGDFVAVKHLPTKKYYLGVLDRHFGFINLDIGTAEPRLFKEGDIEILGKVTKFSTANGKAKDFKIS